MMKRKSLRLMATMLLVAASLLANANPVDIRTAREVAMKFVNANTKVPLRGAEDLQLVTTYNISRGDAAFHIFNTPNGFVIVAADDRATPILGYSDEGQFDAENIPIQLQEYLQGFVEQIEYGIVNNLQPDEATFQQWELVQTTGRLNQNRDRETVGPLLTTTWDQGCYYNELCPEYPAGQCGHVYTGCVATAMAQIMRYWSYPSMGTGSHSYYGFSWYPLQTADFGATIYDWENMPNQLDGYSTSEEINAVATLMWHCGVAINMGYDISGSFSSPSLVFSALVDYFNYSDDLSHVYRNHYNDAEWLFILQSSIDLGRPVLYCGSNHHNYAHAFVCDGYDMNNLLHFNWGWGGQSNGYFAIGEIEYCEGNDAIINIHPNCDQGTLYQVSAMTSVSNGGSVSGSGSYSCGDVCTLTAEPSIDYMFCSWSENGEVVSTDPSYTFAVHCDRDVVANFIEGDGCTITFSLSAPYEGNALTVNYSDGCNSYEELMGSDGALTVRTRNVLDGSHIILGWVSGEYSEMCSFTVSYSNGNVICHGSQLDDSFSYEFDVNCSEMPQTLFNITATTNMAEGGSANGSGEYEYGTVCTLTANASPGYVFLYWAENGNEVLSTDATYSFMVTGNRNITAHFAEDGSRCGIVFNLYAWDGYGWENNRLVISDSFGTSLYLTMGETSYTFLYPTGEHLTLTWIDGQVGNKGCSFDVGYGEGILIYESTSLNESFIYEFDVDCSAPYQTYSINVTSNNTNMGNVSGGGAYGYGRRCTVSATANEGYVFTGWTVNGEAVSVFNEYSFLVHGDMEIEAHFMEGKLIGNAGTLTSSDVPSLWQMNHSLSQQIYTSEEIGEAGGITSIAFCNVGEVGTRNYDIYLLATEKDEFDNTTDWLVVSENDKFFSGEITFSSNVWTFITLNRPFVYDGVSNMVLVIDDNSGISTGRMLFRAYDGFSQILLVNSLQTNYDPFNPWFYEGMYGGSMKNQLVILKDLISYNVVLEPSPTSMGTVSGGGEFNIGETCTVTATPNEGYAFMYWTENDNMVSVEASYSFVVLDNRLMVAHFGTTDAIPFADPNVKQICVDHWDANGDGELSYLEASVVTDLGTVFSENTTITSFEELQYFTGLTSICDFAFKNCSNLTGSLVIPANVSDIGHQAFYGCRGLTGDLIIPPSVTSIRVQAFDGCGFTGQLLIPKSVTYIDYQAFGGCSGFTSLVFDNSSTMVYQAAFMACSGLTSVTIPYTVDSFGQDVFWGCSALESVYYTGNISQWCNIEFGNESGNPLSEAHNLYIEDELVTDLVIGVTDSICAYAFYGCSNLTTVTISNDVKYIGPDAFTNCEGLTSVYYGGELRGWCSIIFRGSNSNPLKYGHNLYVIHGGCYELVTDASIPPGINLSNNVFTGCTSLHSVTFQSPIRFIGDEAFADCVNLTSVTLPNTITSIAYRAFYNCTNLASLFVYAETPPALGSNVFGNVPQSIQVFVPCGSDETYQSTGEWSAFDNYIGMCEHTISVAVLPEDGGSVVGAGSYYAGMICTLRAVCASNYSFLGWYENGNLVYEETNYSFIVTTSRNINAVFCLGGDIVFADDNVKTICVDNWDTNGDGELSYVEAAEVTSLEGVFAWNEEITSFNELQYFVGLNELEEYAFAECIELTSIVIPNSVTSIGVYAFGNCGLTTIEIPASVASIEVAAFASCSGLEQIVVNGENAVYDSRSNCNAIIETATNTLISGCMNTFIPNTVTAIFDEAFVECIGLTSIVIPNSVTSIGEYAFAGSGLTTIEIPASVTSIGVAPFAYCGGLEQIVVNAGNMYYNSQGNCNAIIETNTNVLVAGCLNTIIPNSVLSIGEGAFAGCIGLSTINFPESLTSIGDYAFDGCYGLSGELVIPNSVYFLGDWAFEYCTDLTSIEMPNSLISIGQGAFYECSNLTTLTIPNSVISIGKYAFFYSGWYNNQLDGILYKDGCCLGYKGDRPTGSLQIAEGTRMIADYAFYYCNSLSGDLDIPSAVTVIGNGAFYQCTGFNGSLTIGDSVVSIGHGAFSGCYNLISMIVMPETPPILGDNVFDNFLKSRPVFVPCGYTETYQAAEGWGEFSNLIGMCNYEIITSVDPEEGGSVTGGGVYEWNNVCTLIASNNENYTFMYWTENGSQVSTSPSFSFNVTSNRDLVAHFTLPFTVSVSVEPIEGGTIIGDGEYNYGSTCILMAIPDESYSFIGWEENGSIVSTNTELSFVVNKDRSFVALFASNEGIPFVDPNVKAICVANWDTNGDGELSYAEATRVRHLGNVFRNITEIVSFDELQYFTRLTSIGSYSFYGCSGLISITIPNSVTLIDMAAFAGCSGLISITIPNSVTLIDMAAFVGCSGLISVTIGDSVTSIGTSAFNSCSGLTSVTIGNSVTSIGISAFYHCSGLASVTIGNSVTSIGENAFCGCSNLTSVTIPSGVISIGRWAFEDCTSLSSITVKAITPPTLGINVFYNVSPDIPVYVPCGTMTVYQASTGWNTFTNIQEDCSQTQTQSTELPSGWSWWSSTVQTSIESIQTALGDNLQLIQAKDGTPSGNIVAGEMYKLQTSAPCTLAVTGVPITSATVTIAPGYNWIGFVGEQSIALTQVFANFAASEGDKVISQDEGFAIFEGGAWSGTLENLQPGKGYVYVSNATAPKTLVIGE